jgi:CUB domain
LAIFLALNLVFCGWAAAIEDPVGEEAALSFEQLLSKDLAAEETGPSLRNVCNETLTATNGTITSPNFPQTYESNSNCYWLIVGSTGTIIYLSFDSFVVEAGVDFLRVRFILFSQFLL